MPCQPLPTTAHLHGTRTTAPGQPATTATPAVASAAGVAEALINSLEAKDPYLRGHSRRVALLAAMTAQELELDPTVVADVHLAGRLHDVGMIGIPESILHKPGVLTPDEIRHVREHVRIGVEILGTLAELGAVLQYVHDHHERMDGMGYPRGLKGAEITIGGRILAAADAFDALTSQRPYRDPLSWDAALSRLAGDAGRALDPVVFAALRRVVVAQLAHPEPTPLSSGRSEAA